MMNRNDRIVGGRVRVDKASGAVQRHLMDAPREGFKDVTAEVRLKQFRKSQKEAQMRNQGSSGPSRVPLLKGVPNGGELSTEDTAKRRQQFQDKELSMAIKNALMKKAQLQQQSGVASTPGQRSQPETQRALAQPSLQTVKRLGSNPGSLAGSGCNPTQLRLSAPAAYTGVQKTRGLQLNNSEIEARSQGDFATSPDRRSKTMLALTNATNLTIPGRSADFRSEVEWRLKLRDETHHTYKPAPQPPPLEHLTGPVPRRYPLSPSN